MASDLLSYLVEEKTAELEAKIREEATRQGFQQGAQQSLFQVLDDVITMRFPQAPYTLARVVQRITRPEQLHSLILAAFQAADLTAFEQQVAQVIAASPDAAGSTPHNGN